MRITLSQAVQAIQEEQVIAVPTETVYGLAASLSSVQAIQHVFTLKGRPLINPLIIHVADTAQIYPYLSETPPFFYELVEAFWPGPMTLILPIQQDRIHSVVRANLPTAGFRIPDHPLALELLRQVGPLVMPSANLSGRPSSTTPSHVEEDFGARVPVLDGGCSIRGIESTILAYQEERWVIVRLGSLAPEDFESVLGYQPAIVHPVKGDSQPLCPGQLFRHYAPHAKLALSHLEKLDSIPVILGFNEIAYPAHKQVIRMGSIDEPLEVAEHLYDCLRQLDQEQIKEAWVDMRFPRQGLWLTIAERLERAAKG